MAHSPEISVLMPVFNPGPYLTPAVRSILDQTFDDFELIVVNDGSTDRTRETLARFAAADSRVIVIEQDNAGLIASLNRAIAIARAPLLARMDGDDVSLPERFALQHRTLLARPGLAVLGGHARLIDERGRARGLSLVPVGERAIRRAAEAESPLYHPAVMMRRQAVLEVGGYRPFYESAEDYDLWLRLLDAGYAIDNLNAVLIEYRQHGAGVSSTRSTQQALSTLLALTASRMRRAGLSDAPLAESGHDAAALQLAPETARPCPALVREVLGGLATTARADDLEADAAFVAGLSPSGRCRRDTARVLLRIGVTLVRRGRWRAGCVAIVRAHYIEPIVLVRQLVNCVAKRLVRCERRVRYLLSGSDDRSH